MELSEMLLIRNPARSIIGFVCKDSNDSGRDRRAHHLQIFTELPSINQTLSSNKKDNTVCVKMKAVAVTVD
jgi:hypothetical protein